jgi:hypothetical protein
VQTNFNRVIGGYNPDQWEDTTGKRSSKGSLNEKDIKSGKPFLFYWVNDEIEIIRHRNDTTPVMGSDEVSLLWFGNGLDFRTDKNK